MKYHKNSEQPKKYVYLEELENVSQRWWHWHSVLNDGYDMVQEVQDVNNKQLSLSEANAM